MIEANTPDNVFRFTVQRAADPVFTKPYTLGLRTELAERLVGNNSKRRKEIAMSVDVETIVNSTAWKNADETTKGLADEAGQYESIEQFLASYSVSDATTTSGDLSNEGWTAPDTTTARKLSEDATDILLAAHYGNETAMYSRDSATRILRSLALASSQTSSVLRSLSVNDYLKYPFVLPEALRDDATAESTLADRQSSEKNQNEKLSTIFVREEQESIDDLLNRELLISTTINELLSITPDRNDGKNNPESSTSTITAGTVKKLSPSVRQFLEDIGIDVTDVPVRDLTSTLKTVGREQSFHAFSVMAPKNEPILPDPMPGKNGAIPSGILDLMVVKQHLVGYERTDIAHVENVMAGEAKIRKHRVLERSETTTISDRETTSESETELEKADRFEMNRESERTAANDLSFGGSLSVSGKYGPTVEFTANTQFSSSSSRTESASVATNYARDIVERSLERVAERVREQRIQRITREQEMKNHHELKNDGDIPISGVYQFLEKVYESQVFSYGIRQIFDLMIPEPASFIWHVEESTSEAALPEKPRPFNTMVRSPQFITEATLPYFSSIFGGIALPSPPPEFIESGFEFRSDQPKGNEGGQPIRNNAKEVDVPKGYRPYGATIVPIALTDAKLSIFVTVGETRKRWLQVDEGSLEGHSVNRSNSVFHGSSQVSLNSNNAWSESGKLPIQVFTYETANWIASVTVEFVRLLSTYEEWQASVYGLLREAHEEMMTEYEQRVEELKFEVAQAAENNARRFSDPPTQNEKTIRTELKKHCLAILMNRTLPGSSSRLETDPPSFDLPTAKDEGSVIRFLEQAFEWDQMQHVFYPYFWAGQNRWVDRFIRREVDPKYLEFLQAGSARAVISVRPGFEQALAYYLETGEVWQGRGEPHVTSPEYLPIVAEIKERTGGSKGEIPVEEPWETRLPTPLVILRKEEKLPAWTRDDPQSWVFKEIE